MMFRDFIGIFAAVGLCAAVMWMGLSTPVVQVRHQTGECVQVIPATAGSCAHLPERYETEIVAPR